MELYQIFLTIQLKVVYTKLAHNNVSRRYGYIQYENEESADEAVKRMHRKYYGNETV